MIAAAQRQQRDNWRWIVDNTIDCYGEVDRDERIVRINVKMHQGETEDVLDTFIHEHLHVKYPRMREREVCKVTRIIMDLLTPVCCGDLIANYTQRMHREPPLASPQTRVQRRRRKQ